jgi:hypothetical protein
MTISTWPSAPATSDTSTATGIPDSIVKREPARPAFLSDVSGRFINVSAAATAPALIMTDLASGSVVNETNRTKAFVAILPPAFTRGINFEISFFAIVN